MIPSAESLPVSPGSVRRGQAMCSLGAIVGLLFPKCPLCVMALTGVLLSPAIAHAIKGVGVALFTISLWRLLRAYLSPLVALLCAGSATAILSTIAWILMNHDQNWALYSAILAALTLMVTGWCFRTASERALNNQTSPRCCSTLLCGSTRYKRH